MSSVWQLTQEEWRCRSSSTLLQIALLCSRYDLRVMDGSASALGWQLLAVGALGLWLTIATVRTKLSMPATLLARYSFGVLQVCCCYSYVGPGLIGVPTFTANRFVDWGCFKIAMIIWLGLSCWICSQAMSEIYSLCLQNYSFSYARLGQTPKRPKLSRVPNTSID